MDHQQQIFAFGDELDKLVERYRREFDMTYADVVGVLFMKAHLLCEEASHQERDN